jgi:hypothetical protein
MAVWHSLRIITACGLLHIAMAALMNGRKQISATFNTAGADRETLDARSETFDYWANGS